MRPSATRTQASLSTSEKRVLLARAVTGNPFKRSLEREAAKEGAFVIRTGLFLPVVMIAVCVLAVG